MVLKYFYALIKDGRSLKFSRDLSKWLLLRAKFLFYSHYWRTLCCHLPLAVGTSVSMSDVSALSLLASFDPLFGTVLKTLHALLV